MVRLALEDVESITTATVDNYGRVTPGKEHAGKTVFVVVTAEGAEAGE